MELTFDKATGICEFEVTADFNLHLEREDVGTLHFYQRTTPHGEYDYIKNQGYNADDKVIDLDFQSLVYPKWIKIKSAVIPTVATLSTDGEVREVSYQAKDIEITSNGTTKVTADTGYTALGSVNVKVNVPSEGGGDASTIEYVDISTASEDFKTAPMMSTSIATKAIVMGTLVVLPSGTLFNMINQGVPVDDILAVSVDINMAILSPQGELLTTIKDSLIANGLWEQHSSLPRITKEEFYHILQDEIWTLNTQDDYKAAWDKLYSLVERYGADYINENRLSLAPWYKSLTIGDKVITELYGYSLEETGDFKLESIAFTKYTSIEKYTYSDGTVEYQSYNPPQ